MKHRIFRLSIPLGLVLMLAACGKPAKDTELRAVLKPWLQEEYQWHLKVFTAICQLEEKAMIDIPKRLCPNGPGEPGGKPPAPPAFD